MSFFGKLVKGVVDAALIPIDVVKDVVTMGGTLTDEETPYTVKRVEKVIKDVEEAGEDAGDGNWINDEEA